MKTARMIMVGVAVLLISSLTIKGSEVQPEDVQQAKVIATMSDSVNAIVKNSCFGCHNSMSRNDKAKEDLSFDHWADMKTIHKIGILQDITSTVEEGEMPPKRFLERNPDKALDADQKKLLLDWVKSESDVLLKK